MRREPRFQLLVDHHVEQRIRRRFNLRLGPTRPPPGDPVELAAAVLFLASAAGGCVTGQTFAVDGGLAIT